MLSSARSSVVALAWHRRRGRRRSGSRVSRQEGRERERELSSLFRFPAPLVPLLAGKDDDEDTEEGRKGWKLSQ